LDCFTGCQIIDKRSGEATYIPLGVCIKSRGKIGPSLQRGFLESAIEMFTRGKGVCILFLCDLDDSVGIFAPTKPTKTQKAEENSTSDDVLYDQMNADFTEADQTIVARIVRMPKDDRFGLSHVISNATRLGSPDSEVFAAHAFWKELSPDEVI
jgi:hypothetical protein